ncbi:hypothetical protein CYG49_01220 [Candidatus Saccharibacteria bacterium]|nr:MAG: hypothetical protein CYG49_01220 [Candidatus Saccharibacteria bacterium]
MKDKQLVYINGIKLHYRDTGGLGEKPVIVMVHGIGLSSGNFRALNEVLESTHRVISVDLPHFGSSKTSDSLFSIEQYAQLLLAFLEEIRVRPVALLGNSFGCQIVLDAFLRAKRPIAETAILIGPTVNKGERSLRRQLLRFVQNMALEKKSGKYVSVLIDYLRANPKASYMAMRSSLAYKTEETVGRLKVPILLIRGRKDPFVPNEWVEELAKLSSEANIVEVPKAAHLAHLSHPVDIAAVIRAFLRQE